MNFKSAKTGAMAVALTVLLNPAAAQACTVCFGRSDSKLAEGLNWGIFTLLGIVMVVLGAFGVFAYYLARRSVLSPIPIPPRAEQENQFANQD